MSNYRTMSDAWLHELLATYDAGERIAPRGMVVLEREFVQFTVEDPMTFPVKVKGRDFRDVIGYLEGLSMIAQTNVPATFTDRVRNFQQFTDDGIFYGAYGSRLHGQLGDLVRRIQADPDTRQAVMTIFDGGRDLAASKKDIPCTINFQFLLRNNRLNMRATMRSNDLWLGTPYDLTQFAILQATIAQVLGVKPGYYTHSVGSLHLYERDFPKVDAFDEGGDWPAEESYTPFPLWNADSLAGIVERASRLLMGRPLSDMTDFEKTVWQTLS